MNGDPRVALQEAKACAEEVAAGYPHAFLDDRNEWQKPEPIDWMADAIVRGLDALRPHRDNPQVEVAYHMFGELAALHEQTDVAGLRSRATAVAVEIANLANSV